MLLTTIRAVNEPGVSTNPIHLDEDARAMGLRGGWVGGPTLLGYLADAAVARWGPTWSASGGIDVRFRAPVHDQDELVVELVDPVDDATDGDSTTAAAGTVEMRLVNADGVECTRATVRPPGPVPAVPDEPERGPEPADDDKPVVSLAELERLPVLTSVRLSAPGTADGGPVPVADLVGASIDVMYATFRPEGPRILTRLATTQLAAVEPGTALVARGRVVAAWEHRGRTYATNSVLVSTAAGSPVLHVANTTIWRMPA